MKPPAKLKRPAMPGAGRPLAIIDLVAVERAASIGCNNDEIAALVGVSRSLMFERAASDPAVKDAITRGRNMGRATLRRLQWQGAQKGNATMLIWLGKQMLGQKDRHEHDFNMPAARSDDAALEAIALSGGSDVASSEEVPPVVSGILH